MYKKVLKVQILNKATLQQVVRKRVSFQDRKDENTPKFQSFEIWYLAAFWGYLGIIWVIYNVFVK